MPASIAGVTRSVELRIFPNEQHLIFKMIHYLQTAGTAESQRESEQDTA
jgi:hypothetical protein